MSSGLRLRVQAGRQREPVQKRVRRLPDSLIMQWSIELYIAGNESVAAYDRYRLLERLLDTFALLLKGFKPGEGLSRYVRMKCGLEPPPEGDLGEWTLSTLYGREREMTYFAERLDKLLCLAEALYTIITVLRAEPEQSI